MIGKRTRVLAHLDGCPFQAGSTPSAAGIDFRSVKALKISDDLEKAGMLNR